MAEKLLLRIEQVCERLSLGRTVVYRLIQTEALKSVRIGGSRLVLVADLEAFVSRRGETDEACP
jgi:excisionase family DNA binding protein